MQERALMLNVSALFIQFNAARLRKVWLKLLRVVSGVGQSGPVVANVNAKPLEALRNTECPASSKL